MYDNKAPTKLLPTNPPSRPNISIKAVAIPRYFVGNKFTATAITIFAQLQQLKNTTKLMTIELNSVKIFNAMQVRAEIDIQQPTEVINFLITPFYCRLFPTYILIFLAILSSLDSLSMLQLWRKKYQLQEVFDMIKYFCYLIFHI